MFTFTADKKKQGKQGARGNKQILEENQQTLKFYTYMALIATILYFGTNVYFKWESFSLLKWVWLVILIAIYVGAIQFLLYMAKPKYGEDGRLVDGGLDLNIGSGVAEHVKDLIILTAICQLTSIISGYFWLLWLLAPGRAFQLLWTNVLGPWITSGPPEQEINEKKQKKMERKMAKRHHR